MNQSLSQRLKRCSRYGTSSRTPKRPCNTTSPSASATSSDNVPELCHNISSGSCTKENGTASCDSLPLTPRSSDRMTISAASGSDCSRTPQNAEGHVTSRTSTESPATQSLEELRQRRTQLRNSIASKEQTLCNLNLVKLHRAKVCFPQDLGCKSRFLCCNISCIFRCHSESAPYGLGGP